MNKLLIGVIFIVGAALISLALPRVIGAALLLPGNTYFANVRADNSNASKDVEVAISSRQVALNWSDDGRIWRELGIAHIKKAQASGFRSSKGKSYLAEAKKAIHEGLRRSPGNPFAWSRLAYVEFVSRGPRKAVADALEMSLATGENEPSLILSRLGLALLTWDDLGRNLKNKFLAQLARASKINPKGLRKLGRRTRTTKLVKRLRDKF